MPVVTNPMPSREAYFDRLHQAIVQNDGVVDFAFLLEYGGKQLHYKGGDYNPDANIVTHRLVDRTYDNTLGTTDIDMIHVPVYTKTKTDAQGRTRTRTFNRPRPAPYPETGVKAPIHLAFAKLLNARLASEAPVIDMDGSPDTGSAIGFLKRKSAQSIESGVGSICDTTQSGSKLPLDLAASPPCDQNGQR